MATKSDPQTFVNTGADPALRTIYAGTTQAIPASASTANVYITQTSQVNYTTVKATNVVNQAGGNANSVQFKTSSGAFAGDDGFVYNPDTDTITAGKLVVTANTVSTSIDTGSATFAGGIGIDGNVIANRTLYIGFAANASILLNPTIIAKSTGTTYVQGALINVNESGSADWVAYADNGTETTGWADMGMTGSDFNDPAYTITGINDGYVFVQGTNVAGAGGNLVLATGNLGTTKDIVFATGGFQLENELARFSHANASLELVNAGISYVGASPAPSINGFSSVQVASYIKTNPTTANSLPSASTAGAGARAFVTDATANTFASALTGGGSNKVPVYSDGTGWFVG